MCIGLRGSPRDGLSEQHTRLYFVFGIRQNILTGQPSSRLTEQNHRGATKAEKRLFLSAFIRLVDCVHLHDTANRHCSDFHEAQTAEVVRLQKWMHRSFLMRMSSLDWSALQLIVQIGLPS